MKIRYDFVTNSSSTSFVIINDGEFNFKDFIYAVGINNDSEFIDIYEGLFQSFQDNMEPIREYFAKYRGKCATFEEFILSSFSQNTLSRILEAESQGKKVHFGRLSSENNEVEDFFCTDSFIIDSENLFIDATEDAW